MRKQTILNNLLLSTTVLGALMICQLPAVQAETIAEAAPASLETNLPAFSDSETPSINDGTILEQAQMAENTENQEPFTENPSTTSPVSPTETDENGSLAASPQDTENPSTDTNQPSAPDATTVAEITGTGTETVPATTSDQKAETSPTTQPTTEAPEAIHHQAIPVTHSETIQNNNVGKNSVSITREQPTPQTVKWTVTFDATGWGLSPEHVGAFYFFTPRNAEITSIVDHETNQELIQHFSTKGLYKAYDETNQDEGLSKQWGWSVGNVYYRDPRLDGWKNQGLFSKVFVLNERKDKGPITFTITAKLPDGEVQEFPFVAVMKRYKHIAPTEATSLAATTFEKEPKIILNPLSPETPDPTPKNPAPEEPKSNPETPKENPNEQIQVTFKEGDGTGNTPDTATHYIFGGQIIKMVQPGTLLKSILPMIKIASPGYKPQKGDFILQKGYRIKGWIDENKNPVSEDTIITQSMILSPIIEMDETPPIPPIPTPEEPKTEPEAPKVTPEKPKTQPEAPKVTPEKPKTQPEAPKVTPEKPKTQPEAPKVTPEKPKTQPEMPKVTPEKPKTQPEAPKMTPEKPKTEPEAPKVTPEKPKTQPEAPKVTPEKPKTEPEAPKVTPEKPKTEPEAPKVTPEKPKTQPEAPKVTPEKPKTEPEVPKVISQKTQKQGHSPKVNPNPPASTPTTTISETRQATLPKTGEKSNVLAWLGGILAAILVGILALKPKNSKK